MWYDFEDGYWIRCDENFIFVEGFRAVICDVCLKVTPVTNDLPIVSALLLNDHRMWKGEFYLWYLNFDLHGFFSF